MKGVQYSSNVGLFGTGCASSWNIIVGYVEENMDSRTGSVEYIDEICLNRSVYRLMVKTPEMPCDAHGNVLRGWEYGGFSFIIW